MTELLRKVVNNPRWLVISYGSAYVVLSELYALIEHKGPVESLWWGIVTGSTVGYGDQYPASTLGRGVGAVLIVISVAFVAIATSQLTNHMLTDPDAWRDEEQEELKANVRDLTERLEIMKRQLDAVVQATGAERFIVPGPARTEPDFPIKG